MSMNAASGTGNGDQTPDSTSPRLVVGIGASAGGIDALKSFLIEVPQSSGLSYVVILHLSPDHDSQLAEVLGSATSIPVTQVTATTRLAADHVYVIPPNRGLSIVDGSLVLTRMTAGEQRRHPVDAFFRALAETRNAEAVGVVLSGTGSDGATGLKRIKEAGGLTLVQTPEEAEYADMPNAAIGTHKVDIVSRVADMPRRIIEYVGRIGAELTALAEIPPDSVPQTQEQIVRNILTLVRLRTGHDFANYKTGTVLRRVLRRQALRGLSTLDAYAALLRDQPDEASALLQDLLIGVSNFFRDHEAFATVERDIIPRLFAGKQAHDYVRAWSAGCATGEEAYSLAILLAEFASNLPTPPTIQIFATDLSEQAIAVAREGVYSEADVAEVSEQRLLRFFQRAPGGYRVRRDLRELVLFACHNVIRDPPFSHLDLISCRNLMIYLNGTAQERLLETFQFALRPGGFLFLGLSEVPERTTELFGTADKAAHIYEARSVTNRLLAPLPPATPAPSAPSLLRGLETTVDRHVLPAHLHQRLLEQYAPPSIVVTEDFQLVHVSERAGRYMYVPAGEPSRDALQLVRPELRPHLRMAVQQAIARRGSVDLDEVVMEGENGGRRLRIMARAVLREGDPPRGFVLVLFQDLDGDAPGGSERPAILPAPLVPSHLDDELADLRRQMRATIEQYETQVEEAKASNEELQAMNEELRSSTEELETSKEELQSVNEELLTVNQELKIKVEELSLANNDFANLINSTEIATIFLDRSLRVKLSTPRAHDIFNLRASDRGRPLSDITSRLKYPELSQDLKQVLERLHTIERDVITDDGRHYMMRILPYRTADDRIEGLVLTLLDISVLREAELQVRLSEERLRLMIDSAVEYAIFTMDSEGVVDSWNIGAQRIFGYSRDEIIGKNFAVLFTPEDRKAGVPASERQLALTEGRANDERWHLRHDGTRLYCSGVTIRLGEGSQLGLAKIARDLTAPREAADNLQLAHDLLERRVRERTDALRTEMQQHDSARAHVVTLMRKLVTAQEDQRARIARDLHDQLGQQLIALRLTLEEVQRTASGTAKAQVERALTLASELNDGIDVLAWELRPAVLDDLGLATALPKVVKEWAAHHGVNAAFQATNYENGDLSREAEITFYRIAQEAMTNVVKHAHASSVSVLLETRADGIVQMIVEDDGVGFDSADPSAMDKGIGLVGMRERAALIEAELEVESAPGRGTTIYLRAPKAARSSNS
jgi:two-component system, chemotaxis family, CheB/CheR fusion protein